MLTRKKFISTYLAAFSAKFNTLTNTIRYVFFYKNKNIYLNSTRMEHGIINFFHL